MDTTVILQIVTIVGLIGSYFALYRLLVSQKDATIESSRQQTETIKQQMELMRSESESVVAKALDERVAIMERELERLKAENKAQAEDFQAKRKVLREELISALSRVEQLEKASNLLIAEYEAIKPWIMPYLGSQTRITQTEHDEDDDQSPTHDESESE